MHYCSVKSLYNDHPPYMTRICVTDSVFYGHLMRRKDTNFAKQVTTMKVGGKRPRGRPRLMWMDRVRSDLKQHQLDPKIAQNLEAWRKAVMAINPGKDTYLWILVDGFWN